MAEPGHDVKRFRNTVACSRAATTAGTDEWGNPIGEARGAIAFDAAFFDPTTMAGSQITDGVLRETTTTKPTLMIEPTTANAPALVKGALRSGDALTVDGGTGWEIDGDPALWINKQSNMTHLMVVELRKSVG